MSISNPTIEWSDDPLTEELKQSESNGIFSHVGDLLDPELTYQISVRKKDVLSTPDHIPFSQEIIDTFGLAGLGWTRVLPQAADKPIDSELYYGRSPEGLILGTVERKKAIMYEDKWGGIVTMHISTRVAGINNAFATPRIVAATYLNDDKDRSCDGFDVSISNDERSSIPSITHEILTDPIYPYRVEGVTTSDMIEHTNHERTIRVYRIGKSFSLSPGRSNSGIFMNIRGSDVSLAIGNSTNHIARIPKHLI